MDILSRCAGFFTIFSAVLSEGLCVCGGTPGHQFYASLCGDQWVVISWEHRNQHVLKGSTYCISLSNRCPEADLEGFHSPANSAWMLTVSLFSFGVSVTLDGQSNCRDRLCWSASSLQLYHTLSGQFEPVNQQRVGQYKTHRTWSEQAGHLRRTIKLFRADDAPAHHPLILGLWLLRWTIWINDHEGNINFK